MSSENEGRRVRRRISVEDEGTPIIIVDSDTLIYTAPPDTKTTQYNVLYEMDWACIEVYMDVMHSYNLFSLCITSYASPSCLQLRGPWVRLVHYLEARIQRIVMDTIIQGLIQDIVWVVVHINMI